MGDGSHVADHSGKMIAFLSPCARANSRAPREDVFRIRNGAGVYGIIAGGTMSPLYPADGEVTSCQGPCGGNG